MCQSDIDRVLVDLWVIIDEDEIDYMEDTLADLAGKPTSKDNIFKKVESALSRFLRQKDANGNQYYYESIHVQAARDYENYEYSRAAEPPVQCGVSHLSRRTEPHCL